MPLSRSELDEQLRKIEANVPVWIRNRNSFPEVFEEESEHLVANVSLNDQDYAWQQLEAIVRRSGFNT